MCQNSTEMHLQLATARNRRSGGRIKNALMTFVCATTNRTLEIRKRTYANYEPVCIERSSGIDSRNTLAERVAWKTNEKSVICPKY